MHARGEMVKHKLSKAYKTMLCCKLAKSSFGVHFENPFKRNIRLQQDKKDRKFSVNINIFIGVDHCGNCSHLLSKTMCVDCSAEMVPFVWVFLVLK